MGFYGILRCLFIIHFFPVCTEASCLFIAQATIHTWRSKPPSGEPTVSVTYTRTVVYQVDTARDVTLTTTILPPDYTSSFNEDGTRIYITGGQTLYVLMAKVFSSVPSISYLTARSTFPTGSIEWGKISVMGNLTIPGSTTISESDFSVVSYASSPQPPIEQFTKVFGPDIENYNDDLKGTGYHIGYVRDTMGLWHTDFQNLFTDPPILEHCTMYDRPGGPFFGRFTEVEWLESPSTTYMDLSVPSKTPGATPGSTMVLDDPEDTGVPGSSTESESSQTPSSAATKSIGWAGGPLLFASCLVSVTWCW